jgi:hypothetical protein
MRTLARAFDSLCTRARQAAGARVLSKDNGCYAIYQNLNSP